MPYPLSRMDSMDADEAPARRDGAPQRPADPRPDPLGGRGARPRRGDRGRLRAQAGAGPEAGRLACRACAARSNSPRRWRCCRWCGGACPRRACPSRTRAWSCRDRRDAGRDRRSCAGGIGSSALREGVVQAIGAVPALVALTDRDLAAYHGVEHKAIAAYEQGVEDSATVPKEHDRCGSNLIVPMMLLSAGGTVLLERLVEQPEPARPRRRRPRRRLARGRDVRLERPPPRRAAGRGLPHPRPRDPAPPGDQGADPRAARGRDRGAGRDPVGPSGA